MTVGLEEKLSNEEIFEKFSEDLNFQKQNWKTIFEDKFEVSLEKDSLINTESGDLVFYNQKEGRCIRFFTGDGYLIAAVDKAEEEIKVSSYDIARDPYLENPMYTNSVRREKFREDSVYPNLRDFVEHHEDPKLIKEGWEDDGCGYHLKGNVGEERGIDIFLHKNYAQLNREDKSVFPALFEGIEEYTRNNGYAEITKHELLILVAENRRVFEKAKNYN